MLTFLFLLLFVGNVVSTNSVFIRGSPISSKEYKLTCTISGSNADKYSPHLHCPLTKSHLCYSNCTRHCEFANGNCEVLSVLKPIYDCKFNNFASDHIEIEYFINTENVNNITGEWYCSYAGVNSKAIIIKIPERKITTTKKSVENNVKNRNKNLYTAKIVRVHTVAQVIDVVTLPTVTSKTREITQNSPDTSNDDISFKSFITKFQVVLGILGLFVVSIVLNIIFCIRDSLIKCYIDNIKNNMASDKFLLFCICQRDSISMSATSKLDRILSEETSYCKSDPPNSQNNLYEFDPQGMLIPKQQRLSNDMIPSPPLNRTQSFQYYSPMLPQRQQEQYYMSMPRGNPFYHYGVPMNSNAALIGGGTSLNGSEPFQEEVSNQILYHIDNTGMAIPVKLVQTNSMVNRQSVDLINDCDHSKMSETASNVSKND